MNADFPSLTLRCSSVTCHLISRQPGFLLLSPLYLLILPRNSTSLLFSYIRSQVGRKMIYCMYLNLQQNISVAPFSKQRIWRRRKIITFQYKSKQGHDVIRRRTELLILRSLVWMKLRLLLLFKKQIVWHCCHGTRDWQGKNWAFPTLVSASLSLHILLFSLQKWHNVLQCRLHSHAQVHIRGLNKCFPSAAMIAVTQHIYHVQKEKKEKHIQCHESLNILVLAL